MMLGSPNWIGRIEYLHYDMGQFEGAQTDTLFPNINSSAGSLTTEVVRAGISYRFGEPASSSAALYGKAPAPAPVAPATWAGFYLGAHGGYAWGDDPHSEPLGGTTAAGTSSNGWIAGGQFGHNWQYDRVVAGLEADLSAADIKGSSSTASAPLPPTFSNVTERSEEKVRYLGTARARLGWLQSDGLLLYGSAGLAWERLEQIESSQRTRTAGTTSSTILTLPFDHFGWVAGVGAEMMLGANWIGRLEYLHYDFGRVVSDSGSTQSPPLQTVASSTGRQTIDLLRAGVSYKFGPDLPIATAGEVRYAKAPLNAPLSSRWAGLYAGAHSGYGWLGNNLSNAQVPSGIKAKGWLGGGHVGYLWQYGITVAGLEIDGTATGVSGTAAPGKPTVVFPGETDTVVLSQKTNYLGTVRSRLGWTPAGNWLLYGTGGLAWERTQRNNEQTSVFTSGVVGHDTFQGALDSFGWVAGAGAETFIGSSNWIARLEYLHYDFGNVEGLLNRVSTVLTTPTTSSTGGRQTIDTVRAGLSYKFAL